MSAEAPATGSRTYPDWQNFTPEQAARMEGPTSGFICPFSANTYGIEFLSFTIRDADSKKGENTGRAFNDMLIEATFFFTCSGVLRFEGSQHTPG